MIKKINPIQPLSFNTKQTQNSKESIKKHQSNKKSFKEVFTQQTLKNKN